MTFVSIDRESWIETDGDLNETAVKVVERLVLPVRLERTVYVKEGDDVREITVRIMCEVVA